MSIDRYTEQIKDLLCNVIDMTETLEVIHKNLRTDNDCARNNKKVNSLLNVLAVYGREVDKKARILKISILRDEDENGATAVEPEL